jgi:septal ring factor EnvC (AmiA/AmiB activator)
MRRLALTLLAVLPIVVLAQQRGDREIKKNERLLQQYRAEIQAYEEKIRKSEVREKSTLEILEDLQHQSNLIRKLIKSLKDEEKDITRGILDTKKSVATLEDQLQQLRSHYAKYVQSVYKHGRVYDVELLFSSQSVNQLFIRIEYLKKFSAQRIKDLAEIRQNKEKLESENSQLEKSLAAERELLTEKTREERNLREKTADQRTVLRIIRKNKSESKKALVQKNAAARQVERIIADLVEKEIKRKEREAAEARERELAASRERAASGKELAAPPKPETVSLISNFEQRKGKLRWPVSNGSIPPEGKFGKHTHPDLKTITQNTGVDIKTAANSSVLAVADGEVATLSFIPGFGNILIINHYSGYRTVYAHLADISVSESDKVKEGEVIAHSGESVGGSLLHFEIWKEKDKLNPESWLARRR